MLLIIIQDKKRNSIELTLQMQQSLVFKLLGCRINVNVLFLFTVVCIHISVPYETQRTFLKVIMMWRPKSTDELTLDVSMSGDSVTVYVPLKFNSSEENQSEIAKRLAANTVAVDSLDESWRRLSACDFKPVYNGLF